MKHTIVFMLLALLTIGAAYGQGLETFANFTATGSSYSSGTFLGQDGSTWTYVKARGDIALTEKALMIGRNQTPQSECYSGTISGGIGTLTFDYKQAYTTAVNLNVLVNNAVVGNVTATGQAGVVLSSGLITVDVAGDFVLKFINVNSSDGQVVIDNITWTAYSGGGTPVASTPVIAPATGNYYAPFNATISCSTENSTIYYTLDGTDPDNAEAEYMGPIPISGTTTLKAIAYAPGYDPSPIATAVYTFPAITDVSSILALRAGTIGNAYRLTSEAILTFQQNLYYHPKWVQDATAAIYIYDLAGMITTAYNLGDGITGMLGTLALYNGLLEFVPVADPGAATSTGNAIVPEVRTLDSLTSADQSKLIKVENALIDSSTGNFASGAQNVNVTQGVTTMTMRTFGSTDYNGTPIPTTPQNITCLVGQFNAAMQISPRFLADFESTFDYPDGVPVQVGNDVITVIGGNANNSTGEIPPVNNPTFVASGSYNLELLGAGSWTITIETIAPWGAYYVEGNWHSAPNIDGVITLVIAPTTKGPIVAVILGSEDPTLPVELSSFTAVVTSDLFVNLNWVAESETDHAGYNIYRNGTGDLASAQRINALIIDEGNALGTQISYSYSDFEAYSNMQYYYWLESVSLGGFSQYFGPLQITVGNLEEDPEAPEILLSTKLLNAFPNPFNPNTNLRYTMKEAGNVTIEIFNTKGQLVRSFAASHNSPGFYQMAWDGRDMNGNLVSSGVYMYRMHSGNYSASKRMILAK